MADVEEDAQQQGQQERQMQHGRPDRDAIGAEAEEAGLGDRDLPGIAQHHGQA